MLSKIIPRYFHLILLDMMKLDFAIHLSYSYLLHCQENDEKQINCQLPAIRRPDLLGPLTRR